MTSGLSVSDLKQSVITLERLENYRNNANRNGGVNKYLSMTLISWYRLFLEKLYVKNGITLMPF